MTNRERLCYSCGAGKLRSTNLKGRRFEYRDQRELEFDVDLVVPVCDVCGDLSLSRVLSRRFGEVLERQRLARKRHAAVQFVEMAEREFPGVQRAAWEDAFGLSRGYLSRLLAGSRTADTSLEILLSAFGREPESVMHLLRASGRLPQVLAEAVRARRERQTRMATPPHLPAVPAPKMMSSAVAKAEIRLPAAPRAVREEARSAFSLPQQTETFLYNDPTGGPTTDAATGPPQLVAA